MINIVFVFNPLEPQVNRELHLVKYENEKTLKDYFPDYKKILKCEDVAIVCNSEIANENTVLSDGDFVVIAPVLGHGGAFKILAIVATIALSYYSMGLGAHIAGTTSLSLAKGWAAIGGYLAATATTMIGGVLIAKIFHTYGESRSDTTYGWDGISTTSGQGYPIALTYGTVKSGGQIINQFVEVNNDNQYMNILLSAGEGEVEFSDIRIDDTPASYYDDVDIYTRSGTNDQSPVPNFDDTYSTASLSYELNDNEFRQYLVTGDATEGLVVSLVCSNGLYSTHKGDLRSAWIDIECDYKLHTDDDTGWKSFWGTHKGISSNTVKYVTISLANANDAVVGSYSASVTYTPHKPAWLNNNVSKPQTISATIGKYTATATNADSLICGPFKIQLTTSTSGSWVGGDNGYYETTTSIDLNGTSTGVIQVTNIANSNTQRISASKMTAVRRQFRVDNLDQAEYDVRVKVVGRSNATDSTTASTRIWWEGVSSVAYGSMSYPGVALLGFRALATKQLSGTPTITFLKTRSNVWVWNSNTNQYESEDATNPAWAAYDYIHQCRMLLKRTSDGSSYPTPTFTRSSVATDENGNQVAAGVPRFTDDGLMIEEGTTNLYDRKHLQLIANNGTTVSITQITDDVPSSVGKFYRVDGNADNFTGDPSVWGSGWWCGIERGMGTTMSLKAGDVLALSAWVKAPEGKAYNFNNSLNKDGWKGNLLNADVEITTSTDGQWHRYTALLKLKEDYNGDPIVDMFTHGYLRETRTYYIGGWQIEKSPYSTSYIDAGTTRAAEALTVPASVASSDDITIEMTVVTPSAITYTNRTLFNGYSAKHRFLWYIPGGGTQIMIAYRDTSNSEKYIMMFPNIIDGSSHKIALTHQQSTGIIKMYVDGALTGSGVMSSLDTSLTGDYTIGSQNQRYCWNHPIRDIRISNTVHTADKIIADQQLGRLQVEADTTYYLPLKKDINPDMRMIDVKGAPANLMLYDKFKEWADFCDTKDLHINIEINTASATITGVNTYISPVGYGLVIPFGTKFGCVYDHVQQPVQMFGMGNIVAGSFSQKFSGSNDRANSVEVTFNNKEKNYQKDVATYYGEGYDNPDNSSNPTQFTMNGIVTYEQAYRFARFMYLCNAYLVQTCTFTVAVDAINCTVGDLVLVSHLVPEWAASGRIWSVNGRICVTDAMFMNFDPLDKYEMVYRSSKTDTIYTVALSSASVNDDNSMTLVIDASASPAEMPAVEDICAVAKVSVGVQPCIVKSINSSRGGDYNAEISCLQYNEAVFDESEEIPDISYSTADNTPHNPDSIAGRQVQYLSADGTLHCNLYAWWTDDDNPDEYYVYISSDGGENYTYETSTTAKSFTMESTPGVEYYVMVKSVKGVSVSTGIVGIVPVGIDLAPDDVTGLSATQDLTDSTLVNLTWTANTDVDLKGYRIYVDGVVEATLVTDTKYTYQASVSGDHTFSVVAVDNAGNESSDQASATLSMTIEPADVSNFVYTTSLNDRSVIAFSWNQNTEINLSYYEIREGDSWSDGTAVVTKIKATTASITLPASGNYTYWIKAFNTKGFESVNAVSINIQSVLEPSVPANLLVVQSDQDHTKAVISFTASAGADIAYYTVKYGASWDSGTLVSQTKETSLNWTIPTSGTYHFMVMASTVAGYGSQVAYTDFSATIEPSSVTGFTATQSNSDKQIITLSWDALAEKDISYYVLKEGQTWSSATLLSARVSSTFFDIKVSDEDVHYYLIKAVSVAGYESVTAVMWHGAFNMHPSAVSNLSAKQDASDVSKLNIMWQAVDETDIVGYQVRIGTTWENSEMLPFTKELKITYSLVSSGTKHIMIKSLNNAGYYSDEYSIDVTVSIVPALVSGLSVTQLSTNATQVKLLWTANTDNGLSGYRIYVNNKAVSDIITDTSYVYTVPSSGTYSFYVNAINNLGNESNSANAVSLTVKVEPADVSWKSMIQNVTDRTKATLSWTANTELDLSYYEIREGTDWDSGTIVATKTKAVSLIHQLEDSKLHVFMIKAVNAEGYYSVNAASLQVQVDLTPGAISDLTAVQSDQNKSQMLISFTKGTDTFQDIAKYIIKYGDTWNSGTIINQTKELSYLWTVPSDGTYTIMVQAVTVGGYTSSVVSYTFSITVSPLNVTNFIATQSVTNKESVRLSWDSVQEKDVSYYVIKEGTSWDSGTVVVERVSNTFYDVIISDETVHNWMIKAVTIAGNSSQQPTSISGNFTLTPSAVTSMQAFQDSDDRSVLHITWGETGDTDLYGYEVRIGSHWDSAEALPVTPTLYETYSLSSSGALHIMIKAINNAGYYSDEFSIDTTVKVEPTDVTGLVVFQNGDSNQLYWDDNPDNDVVGYEIREGYSFDQGILISTGVTNTNFTIDIDTARYYHYFVKAINRAGFYSQNAADYGITITDLSSRNVIDTYDEIVLQNGTLSNTVFGSSLINFQTLGGKFSDYPDTKFSDIGGSTVLKLAQSSSGVYYPSGTYTTPVIDVSSVITCNVTVLFQPSTVVKSGSANLTVRMSQDNSTWTDWEVFKPVQRTFRYIQFMVSLATDDTTQTPEVNKFSISIDVPDTPINLKNVTIAKGGTAVPYGHTYYENPNVQITAIGIGLHGYVTAADIGKSQCIVYVYDKDNNDVGGQANIYVGGY